MNYSSVATGFNELKDQVKRSLEGANALPPGPDSPEWYSGLAVSPATFSRQLSDMQISLQRANRAVTSPDQFEVA